MRARCSRTEPAPNAWRKSRGPFGRRSQKKKPHIAARFLGGQGEIRTPVARSAAGLQPAAIVHSATYPFVEGRAPQYSGAPRGLSTAIFVARATKQESFGAPSRTRTGDLPLTRRELYQLSYQGVPETETTHPKVRRRRFRPAVRSTYMRFSPNVFSILRFTRWSALSIDLTWRFSSLAISW